MAQFVDRRNHYLFNYKFLSQKHILNQNKRVQFIMYFLRKIFLYLIFFFIKNKNRNKFSLITIIAISNMRMTW